MKWLPGNPDEIAKNKKSITGKYLNGSECIAVPAERRSGTGEFLTVTGCRANNLKNIDVSIPVGTLSCITGVSGAGEIELFESNSLSCPGKPFQ